MTHGISATVGYVPSLETFPALEWASDFDVNSRACPSYGNMVRGLLTGKLEFGVIPLEIFVTDLLSRPGQSRAWKIPAVLKSCPIELALSKNAQKLVYPSRRQPVRAGSVDLVVGVEARHSFTRHQILAWIAASGAHHLRRPTFKVLTMDLMIKALKHGEIDAMLAPSPWGLQAEFDAGARIDRQFNEGDLGQHVVMVCHDRLSRSHPDLLQAMPQEMRKTDALNFKSEAFKRWAGRICSGNACSFSDDLCALAAKRYSLHLLPDEFTPDAGWLESELTNLVKRGAVSMSRSAVTELASNLCLEA